jgi:hypothetical protein
MTRWILFILAILIGIGLGLVYGWLVNPVDYVNTVPETLRIDYRTDYVLMASEAYQGDNDPELATRRLALLGDTPAKDIVYQAILFAQNHQYTDDDLSMMQQLLGALQAFELSMGTQAP